MIAPTAHGCKRVAAGAFELVRDGGSQPLIKREIYRHGIVSGIIIPPNFRLSTALLDCDKGILRWPGPFGTGFLSPQPPGVVRIGPVARSIPQYWTNESWSFFFLGFLAGLAFPFGLANRKLASRNKKYR